MIYTEKPEGFNSKFEVVGCFFEHDGKLLLLHRKDTKPEGNTWCVPGGKVDPGETPVDALLRELREETGYHAQYTEPIHSHSMYVRYPDYDFVYHTYSVSLSEPHTVVVEQSAHKAFDWVTPEQALEKNLITDEDVCIKLHYKMG